MKLNFGCGQEDLDGYYNVDGRKKKHIHKVFDFDKFPYPLKDNSFTEIKCCNVLEHCLYPKKVMEEFWRASKPNGIIKIQVPYVGSRSAVTTFDHISFFNRWSFTTGNVNACYEKDKFEIIKNKIYPQRFLKWVPMPILNILATFLNTIFVDIDAEIKVIKDTFSINKASLGGKDGNN